MINKLKYIVVVLLCVFSQSTNAAVLQSADSAFSNDVFVSSKSSRSSISTQPNSEISSQKIDYNYNKNFAAKRFQTLSGHLTLEQNKLPRRLSVEKGTTLQFNLKEIPNAIWNVEINEKIGKVIQNKVIDNQRIITIQTLSQGKSRIYLDNISTKDNQYKALFNKKLLLVVK